MKNKKGNIWAAMKVKAVQSTSEAAYTQASPGHWAFLT